MERMKMSNIKALRQRYADHKKVLKALLDKAAAEKRDLSGKEIAQYDSGISALTSTEHELQIEEDTLAIERGQAGDFVGNGNGEAFGAQASPRRSSPKGKRYADLFGPVSNSGFADFNDFIRAVHSGMNDARFQAVAQGMGGNSPTDGGFLIPTSYSAELLDQGLESEIVRPRAYVTPMTTSSKRIAGLDDLDNSGSAPYGGLALTWANEGDAPAAKKAKTRQIELIAKKAMLFAFASNELIADGLSFDEMIGQAMQKSLSWGLDNAFLNGDGAGKPLGVLNDPALIVVAKETSPAQGANTVWYQNIVNMFSRLHPACLANSVWVANSSTLPQLLRMQITVMNVAGSENVGGSAVPVFSTTGGDFRLLGRPVLFTEKLPALSSQGDIIFCDFSQYCIGLRKEITLERSIYAGWSSDESAYRAIVRCDGQGKWKGAFKPKAGNTSSWCVALGAR
jgi:HK97 family phage major capsid protein